MLSYLLCGYILLNSVYGIFTYRDSINGNIAIGSLPEHLVVNFDFMAYYYKLHIPDETLTTHHMWYNDVSTPHYLKTTIDNIQYHTLWDNLCDQNHKCKLMVIPEMTELYYSNPYKKTKNLYGAAANFDPHRDCFYQFESIKLYRVLIGLTDGNNNTITYFPTFNIGHKLNKGDYIVFDFDRTLHQVIKQNQSSSKRILLKLHYLVFEKEYSETTIIVVRYMYIYYDYITRYILESGTDPESFFGFFMGLLSEIYINYISIHLIVFLCNSSIFLVYYYKYKIIDIIVTICKIYMMVVCVYWLRYKLFNIK